MQARTAHATNAAAAAWARACWAKVTASKLKLVIALAKNALFVMKQHDGFLSANFFADWENGEGGAMSLWNSLEEIEAYRAKSRGIMRIAASGLFLEPAKVVVAEIIEPYQIDS